MNTDEIADKFLTGELTCECPELNELVSKVRRGEMDIQEFKNFLKAQQLRGLT